MIPFVVPASTRRLAAIMFTDMVGYSALAQQDEDAAISALDDHNRALRPLFEKHHGREVKTIGDAFLVEFGSALDAVQCAVEMQRTLAQLARANSGDRPIQIRIGIHVGDVVETDGDVLGDAVNIASRIEPLATPGGICLTQQVYDQVQNKVPAVFAKLAPVTLKNIRSATNVYRIVGSERPPATSAPTVPKSRERNVAVLPLANISQNAEDDYFADGLTDELISVLSQIRGLSVIARTSVMPYKTAPKGIAQVGAELGVDVVLEGSVRRAGNKVRVSLQLVDASTQRHLWAGSINREIDDVFEVQAYVAGRAARALRLTLNKTARAMPRPPPVPNPKWGVVTAGEAYDAYLRGLVASNNHATEGPDEAFRWFERATHLDPSMSDAFAAWANLYVIIAGEHLSMREAMPRAKELAARALELDPDSSDAHTALANIALQFDNDWALAESEFRLATSLNPSNAVAYQFYGLLLMTLGRFDEAKDAYRHATRLDPAGHHRNTVAWVEAECGNYERALEYFAADEGVDVHSSAHHQMRGMFFLRAGRPADAIREADAAPPPQNDDERFDLALLNALVGRPEPSRKLLAEISRGKFSTYLSPIHLAMMYAAIGEREKALDLVEKDYREGDHMLWISYRGVFFDSIRDDPRFVAIMREMGLPLEAAPGPAAPRDLPK
jgi:adenylate cyclase